MEYLVLSFFFSYLPLSEGKRDSYGDSGGSDKRDDERGCCCSMPTEVDFCDELEESRRMDMLDNARRMEESGLCSDDEAEQLETAVEDEVVLLMDRCDCCLDQISARFCLVTLTGTSSRSSSSGLSEGEQVGHPELKP